MLTLFKVILDSHEFWIPNCKFRFLVTNSGFFVSGTWIPDSNCRVFKKIEIGSGFE